MSKNSHSATAIFTPRNYAIFKQIWSLTKDEIAMLDRYFILRTTGAILHRSIDRSHEYRDMLKQNGINYEVQYRNCCFTQFEVTGTLFKETLLLSFRHNETVKFSSVIVSLPYNTMKTNILAYREFA